MRNNFSNLIYKMDTVVINQNKLSKPTIKSHLILINILESSKIV